MRPRIYAKPRLRMCCHVCTWSLDPASLTLLSMLGEDYKVMRDTTWVGIPGAENLLDKAVDKTQNLLT